MRRVERVGLCECGCGQETTNRFLRGHWAKVQAATLERGVIEDRGYATPCHIWVGARSSKGYAQAWNADRKRMEGAHRVAWRKVYGEIPEGFEIDHLCFQRDCVRVDHLELVTHAENVRRSGSTAAIREELLRALRSGQFRDHEIAERFGLALSTITRFRRREGLGRGSRWERADVTVESD